MVDSDDIFEGILLNLQVIFHSALSIVKGSVHIKKKTGAITLISSSNVEKAFHTKTAELLPVSVSTLQKNSTRLLQGQGHQPLLTSMRGPGRHRSGNANTGISTGCMMGYQYLFLYVYPCIKSWTEISLSSPPPQSCKKPQGTTLTRECQNWGES